MDQALEEEEPEEFEQLDPPKPVVDRKRKAEKSAKTPAPKKRKQEPKTPKSHTIDEFFPRDAVTPPPTGVNRRTAVLHSNKKNKTPTPPEEEDEPEIAPRTTRSTRLTAQFTNFRLADVRSPMSVEESESSATETQSSADEDDDLTITHTTRSRRRTHRMEIDNRSNEAEGRSLSAFRARTLDQVWAEFPCCFGSISSRKVMVPGLVVSPSTPPEGLINNGGMLVPPPPPQVLKDRPKPGLEPHLLIMFFNEEHSWKWVVQSKLEQFGLEDETDRGLRDAPKRQQDKGLVMFAYNDACYYRWRLLGEAPDDQMRESFEKRYKEEKEKGTEKGNFS